MQDFCLLYHASFNPIIDPSIRNSSSLSLQVFDVFLQLTFLLTNCLTCCFLINYQYCIWSILASCTMSRLIPSWLQVFTTHLA
jgi:hypothetical protein